MAQSGEFCLESGMFEGDDVCHARVQLRDGEEFPPCPQCQRLVNWNSAAGAPSQRGGLAATG